jgi:hypothetical protein
MPTAWNSFITALIASSVFCSVDGEQAANTITDAATAIKNLEMRIVKSFEILFAVQI